MLKKKITTLGNSAAVILPKDILDLLELSVGDEVELKLKDKTLQIVKTKENTEDDLFESALDVVFKERANMLRNLAKGSDE